MNRARVVALFAAAAAVPLLLDPGGATLNTLTVAAAYVVMALGLNVIVGYAGLLDLGYVAFFAFGAYTTAHLASGFRGIHLDLMLVLVLAGSTAALAGAVIGIPTLRLRGDYIAVVTLAFGEIISRTISIGGGIGFLGGTLTSGPVGIGPIDRIELPVVGRFGVVDLRPWYWFALALVALAVVVSVNLRRSRIGRAWVALRDDELGAVFAGIPAARTRLAAYSTGAALGGVSGAFLASYLGVVNPAQFEFSFSIFVLAMVVLGGTGSVAGVIAGAIALSVLNTALLPGALAGLPRALGLDFDLSVVSGGVWGVVLVALVLLAPEPRGPSASPEPDRPFRRRRAAAAVATGPPARRPTRGGSAPAGR